MEKVRIQDDLYLAVNQEKLDQLEIPADLPMAGGFAELEQDVEKTLINDFQELAEGKITTEIKEMNEAINLFNMYKDVEKRTKDGIAPVMPILNKIKGMKDTKDLNKNLKEFLMCGVELPLRFGVTENMANATKYAFILVGPNIILPDTTYYAEGNPVGQQLLGLWQQMASMIIAKTDLTEEEQAKFIEDTLAFDKLVSKSVKSQLEWSDYVNNHNPLPIDESQELVAPLDLKGLLMELYGKLPNEVIAYDLRAIKEFKQYFNDANFEMFKHWCYVKTLVQATSNLSPELTSLGNIYTRALLGVQEDAPIEKQAYRLASTVFDEPVGVYYGRKYFGEEAKKDVVEIVKKIIETYKLRMNKNDFLAPETKERAIKKLSTIKIKMGFPDNIDETFSKMIIDPNKSLFDNMLKINQIKQEKEFFRLFEDVDKTKWVMPGHMVNACYNPTENDITFPAAVLQPPFYSIKQSLSENLGGIGAVIGHEISHAFDNNGAHFDELGNIKNWWKEDDFKAFQAKTAEMIKQFDGIEFHGGKVNGELVVSENIADNGGMGVTLEIMHTLKDANYQEYFMNWARVWCMKAKEEFIMLLLQNDVHSPNVLRANMPPRNFKEWYEAFDVKETDKMFIPEDKRISIW